MNEPTDGFCAIYEPGDRAQTLFTGDFGPVCVSNRYAALEKTIDLLSRNVMEQGMISFPPRKLKTLNGDSYVMRRGVALLFAAYGLGMADWHLNQERITSQLGDPVVTILGGSLVYILGLSIVSTTIGRYLGFKADQWRLRHLPEEAKDYRYGLDAYLMIEKEHQLWTEGTQKKQKSWK